MPAKCKNGKLPINLLRKLVREERHSDVRKSVQRCSRLYRKQDNDLEEHEALVQATEAKLRRILENNEFLSDIPFDSTPEELLGELAIVNGHATMIHVQREGLSTLHVVLPEAEPTIANLKRAIESLARAQLKRELRERHEERLQRRRRQTDLTTNNGAKEEALLEQRIRSTGELVYSVSRCGHKHRTRVSWRYLWRAFCLFNVDTNQPIADANGRKLLSDCGIINATRLKFTRRDIYFKRKRQK